MRKTFVLVTLVLSFAVLFLATTGESPRPPVGASRVLDESQGGLEVFDRGAGEVVVLLASLGRSVSDFNELVRALNAAGYRTLAVELRGVGRSRPASVMESVTLHDFADDVAAVVSTLAGPRSQRVHVLGHAFGNRVARTFASDHPDRVKSIILAAAGGRVEIAPAVKRALFLSFFMGLPRGIQAGFVRQAFFSEESKIPTYWLDGWNLGAALVQARATRSTDVSEWWAGGTAPILILQPADDAVAPAEHTSELLANEFGERVTIVTIPKSGHALLPEQPGRVQQAIIDFLRTIDDGKRFKDDFSATTP